MWYNKIFSVLYSLLLIGGIYSNAVADEKAIAGATTALVVWDLEKQNLIQEENGDKLFLPASTLKLFTAYAALKVLGPNYVFESPLYTEGRIKQGKLYGDVYIQFTGAPEVGIEDIRNIPLMLRKLGIEQVQGDVIIDDRSIDEEFPRGRTLDDQTQCYAALATGVIINQNCISAKVAQMQDKLEIEPLFGVSFTDLTINSKEAKGVCELKLKGDENNHYTLYGCWQDSQDPIFLQIALRSPRLYAKNIIEKALQNEGIEITGELKFGSTSKKVKKQGSWSKPVRLKEIIKPFLKDSINIYGEVLVKKVAHHITSHVGNTTEGVRLISALINKELGLPEGSVKIADGAGGSHYNLVTANALTRLLIHIAKKEKSAIRESLLEALPQGGVDGTLKERFKAFPALQPKVWAKTGTLTGVNNLAGYISEGGKSRYVIVSLINHYYTPMAVTMEEYIASADRAKEVRKYQDGIIAGAIPSGF
jgi:D-alanyl-D-alanine carboxypeptidase/D-alanyl-D-alanine-endopeptidase (penicillin-binding protein 4)